MSDPVVAQASPYRIDVVRGRTYFGCACGRSRKQPFCGGSHKGTGFSPVQYKADMDRKAYFCGCKRTGRQPLCDGTHNRL